MLLERQDRSAEFEFSGSVPVARRVEVEALFFFNPNQGAHLGPIRQTVESDGAPFIFESQGRIRIAVPPDTGSTQCLFVSSIRGMPWGVAIYDRPEREVLRISHLAVDPSVRCDGIPEGIGVAGVLVEKVRDIARCIKGVSRIRLPYRRAAYLRVAG